MANVAIICKTIINLASKQKRKKEDLGIRRIRQDVNKTSHSNFSITPFRIENAQWQQLPSLISAHFVGGLNEKRCKLLFNILYVKIKMNVNILLYIVYNKI